MSGSRSAADLYPQYALGKIPAASFRSSPTLLVAFRWPFLAFVLRGSVSYDKWRSLEIDEGGMVGALEFFRVSTFSDLSGLRAASDGVLGGVSAGQLDWLLERDGALASTLVLAMGSYAMLQCVESEKVAASDSTASQSGGEQRVKLSATAAAVAAASRCTPSGHVDVANRAGKAFTPISKLTKLTSQQQAPPDADGNVNGAAADKVAAAAKTELVDHMKGKLQEEEKKVAAYKQRFFAAKNRLATAQNGLSSALKKLATKEEEIDNLNRELDAQRARCGALEVIQQDRDELLRVNATLVSVAKAVENWSKSKDYQEFVLWK